MYSSKANGDLIKKLKKWETIPLRYEQHFHGVVVNRELLLRPTPLGVILLNKPGSDWQKPSSYKKLIQAYCAKKMKPALRDFNTDDLNPEEQMALADEIVRKSWGNKE